MNSDEGPPLKASELVKKLQDLIEKHGDLDVNTEGCDCHGPAADVEFYDHREFLVTRSSK